MKILISIIVFCFVFLDSNFLFANHESGLRGYHGIILGLILCAVIGVIVMVILYSATYVEYIKKKKKDKSISFWDLWNKNVSTTPVQKKPKQETKPKEILTWDKSVNPEPKKEEPVKEEPQPTEVTITTDEEEEIYAKIGKELKENRNEGAWLKFYTECDGNEQKAKIAYIKKRVASLMEELKKNKTQ